MDNLNRKNEAPGPGYYNYTSAFDMNNSDSNYQDMHFTLQLNAARKKQSSMFASGTERASILHFVKEKIENPGLLLASQNYTIYFFILLFPLFTV